MKLSSNKQYSKNKFLIIFTYFYAVGLNYWCHFNITFWKLNSFHLIIISRIVHSYEQEVASSMMAAFLGVGLAFGSGLGLILVKIL